MQRKTLVIFIIVFSLLGIGIFLMSRLVTTKKVAGPQDTDTSTYRQFESLSGEQEGTLSGIINRTIDSLTGTQTTEPSFSQITDFQIAGMTYLEDTRQIKTEDPTAEQYEIVPSLRYVERATGYIHQIYLDTKKQGVISNASIPGVQEVLFGNNGQTVIYRYIDTEDRTTINSFIATLGGEKGEFLPDNIISVNFSPENNSIFYIVKDTVGVRGIIKSITETKTSQLWTSPFSEWVSEWPTQGTIFLTTKPSWRVEGSLWGLNTKTGVLTKILSGIPGLTTHASRDASHLIYNTTTTNGPRLSVYSMVKNTTLDLGVYGLPEKCVWSNLQTTVAYCALPALFVGTAYPDSWYQGKTSFDDRFVKINAETGIVTQITEGQHVEQIDAITLSLNKTEDTLFFINKKDSTLWSLSLTQ